MVFLRSISSTTNIVVAIPNLFLSFLDVWTSLQIFMFEKQHMKQHAAPTAFRNGFPCSANVQAFEGNWGVNASDSPPAFTPSAPSQGNPVRLSPGGAPRVPFDALYTALLTVGGGRDFEATKGVERWRYRVRGLKHVKRIWFLLFFFSPFFLITKKNADPLSQCLITRLTWKLQVGQSQRVSWQRRGGCLVKFCQTGWCWFRGSNPQNGWWFWGNIIGGCMFTRRLCWFLCQWWTPIGWCFCQHVLCFHCFHSDLGEISHFSKIFSKRSGFSSLVPQQLQLHQSLFFHFVNDCRKEKVDWWFQMSAPWQVDDRWLMVWDPGWIFKPFCIFKPRLPEIFLPLAAVGLGVVEAAKCLWFKDCWRRWGNKRSPLYWWLWPRQLLGFEVFFRASDFLTPEVLGLLGWIGLFFFGLFLWLLLACLAFVGCLALARPIWLLSILASGSCGSLFSHSILTIVYLFFLTKT